MVIPLIAVAFFVLVEMYYRAGKLSKELFDNTLLATAVTISEYVVATGGDLLSSELKFVFGEVTQDQVYYYISGPGGGFISGYAGGPELPQSQGEVGSSPVFFDSDFREKPVRVVTFTQDFFDRDTNGVATVKVWQTIDERQALLLDIIGTVALRLLAFVGIACLIIWFGIKIGLKPLAKVEAAVGRRSLSDLRPIQQNVPEEIQNLVLEMNQLFVRLQKSVADMDALISNASHQLKTPLAIIQSQAELALRAEKSTDGEVKARLQQIVASTIRTSRLADQLLTLAKIDAEECNLTPNVFDVLESARDVATRSVSASIARNIDFGFAGPDEPIFLCGNEFLFCEALQNLVDNALKYCPSGSTVTLRVYEQNGGCSVQVEDDGPGVPDKYLSQLSDRFFRVPGTNGEGCGLGLAIARETAVKFGAGFEVGCGRAGHGFLARFNFPNSVQNVAK